MADRGTPRRHRDRHRNRRSDPKTIKRLRKQEQFNDDQVVRLNAFVNVSGVTRDEVADSFRVGPAAPSGKTVDTRCERIRDVGDVAADVDALGIPSA